MAATVQPTAPARAGKTWIPAGAFDMGSEEFYPEERPVRRVSARGSGSDAYSRARHPVVHVTPHRYRPTARQGEAIDISTSHIGFRCVVRA